MLTDDVIAFLRSRPIGILCTRDRENHPAEHECFLAEVTTDRVIGLVPEHLARHLRENVADNGHAALVVSRQPGDHRSIQMKGRITDFEDARPRGELFVQMAKEPLKWWLSTVLPAAGVFDALDRMSRQPMFRLQFDVSQVFDQSPGPKAGLRIAGGDP